RRDRGHSRRGDGPRQPGAGGGSERGGLRATGSAARRPDPRLRGGDPPVARRRAAPEPAPGTALRTEPMVLVSGALECVSIQSVGRRTHTLDLAFGKEFSVAGLVSTPWSTVAHGWRDASHRRSVGGAACPGATSA